MRGDQMEMGRIHEWVLSVFSMLFAPIYLKFERHAHNHAAHDIPELEVLFGAVLVLIMAIGAALVHCNIGINGSKIPSSAK